MHACSAPPIYWSTGSQYSAMLFSKGFFLFLLSANRRKYQLESTKVSIVSVSLFAFPLHFGHFTSRKDLLVASGFPVPNSTFSGSRTGKSFSGTGTIPHFSQ